MMADISTDSDGAREQVWHSLATSEARMHALLEAAVDGIISVRSDLDPPPATVCHLAGRLEQQQAMFRAGGKHPPATCFLHQGVVVGRWIETEDGQFRAVFSRLI